MINHVGSTNELNYEDRQKTPPPLYTMSGNNQRASEILLPVISESPNKLMSLANITTADAAMTIARLSNPTMENINNNPQAPWGQSAPSHTDSSPRQRNSSPRNHQPPNLSNTNTNTNINNNSNSSSNIHNTPLMTLPNSSIIKPTTFPEGGNFRSIAPPPTNSTLSENQANSSNQYNHQTNEMAFPDENNVCSNFVCCGQYLSDLHVLLQHYEEHHVKIEDEIVDIVGHHERETDPAHLRELMQSSTSSYGSPAAATALLNVAAATAHYQYPPPQHSIRTATGGGGGNPNGSSSHYLAQIPPSSIPYPPTSRMAPNWDYQEAAFDTTVLRPVNSPQQYNYGQQRNQTYIAYPYPSFYHPNSTATGNLMETYPHYGYHYGVGNPQIPPQPHHAANYCPPLQQQQQQPSMPIPLPLQYQKSQHYNSNKNNNMQGRMNFIDHDQNSHFRSMEASPISSADYNLVYSVLNSTIEKSSSSLNHQQRHHQQPQNEAPSDNNNNNNNSNSNSTSHRHKASKLEMPTSEVSPANIIMDHRTRSNNRWRNSSLSMSAPNNPHVMNPKISKFLKKKAPISLTTIQKMPIDKKSPRPYVCIECGKSYKNPNGLKYHASHGHDGTENDSDKPYKCLALDCGKRYKNPNGLKYHMAHGHLDKKALIERIVGRGRDLLGISQSSPNIITLGGKEVEFDIVDDDSMFDTQSRNEDEDEDEDNEGDNEDNESENDDKNIVQSDEGNSKEGHYPSHATTKPPIKN